MERAARPVSISTTVKPDFSTGPGIRRASRFRRTSCRTNGSSTTTKASSRRSATSAGSAAGEDCGERLEDEIHVTAQTPVVDVLHVHVHPLLEGDLAAAGHLPDAGQARA